MRINYIRQVQAFNDRLLSNPLSSGQIALWHALMHINNKCAWVEWFTAANLSLEALCGLSRQGINKARNVLKQEGLIEFKSNGTKATSYKIIVLNNSTTSDSLQASIQDSVQNSIQGGLQAGVQSSVQNSSTLNKQNKTKLNETKEYSVGLSPNAPVPPGQNDELEDIMVPFQKILDYLNDKTGKHFQNIAGNQRHIQSRWNEGNRFEDFKTVIDNMVEQWDGKYFNGEPMDQYLRPSTLFGDKFDQYLNMTPPEKEETYARDESEYDLF